MLAPNVFCVAADEDEFRYGTVLFHDASKEDVDRHLDEWGRWLSLYPDHHGWWNEREATHPADPLETPVKGLLRLKPAHVLDFLQHFAVFETKRGATAKKVAPLSPVRGGERVGGPHGGAGGSASNSPGSDRPHLAHPRLGEVAHDGVRGPEAAPASGPRQSDRADSRRPARSQDPTRGRLRSLRLPPTS